MGNPHTRGNALDVGRRLVAKAAVRSTLGACLAALSSLSWATDFVGPTDPRSNQECNAFAFRALADIHREFNQSRATCEQYWEAGGATTQGQLKRCYREAADRRSVLVDALNRERTRCADKVLASRW
jgi:hypothetical protein